MSNEIEKLEDKVEKLTLTTSHTKRTSLENGKKINVVEEKVDEILTIIRKGNKEFSVIVDKLTGVDGYFEKTNKNANDIELQEIKLNKAEIRQVKIIVFAITAGLIMGWLIKQYSIEAEKRDNQTALYYHRTNEKLKVQ